MLSFLRRSKEPELQRENSAVSFGEPPSPGVQVEQVNGDGKATPILSKYGPGKDVSDGYANGQYANGHVNGHTNDQRPRKVTRLQTNELAELSIEKALAVGTSDDPFRGHAESVAAQRKIDRRRRSSIAQFFAMRRSSISTRQRPLKTFMQSNEKTLYDAKPKEQVEHLSEDEVRQRVREKVPHAEIKDYEYAAFYRVFNYFDRAGSGTVPAQLLGSMMRSLGMNPSTTQVTDIELEVDSDESKALEFVEFVHAMVRGKYISRHERQDIISAFTFFDDDGSGDILVSDLRNIILMSGEDLTIEEIDDVLADADRSGDGRLDFQEFAMLMSSGGLVELEKRAAAATLIQRRFHVWKQKKLERLQMAKDSEPKKRKKLFGLL